MKSDFQRLRNIRVGELSVEHSLALEDLLSSVGSEVVLSSDKDLAFLEILWLSEKMKRKRANRNAMQKIEEFVMELSLNLKQTQVTRSAPVSHGPEAIVKVGNTLKRRIEEGRLDALHSRAAGSQIKPAERKKAGYAGVFVLNAELDGKPEKAARYSEKYSELVGEIVEVMRGELAETFAQESKKIAKSESEAVVESIKEKIGSGAVGIEDALDILKQELRLKNEDVKTIYKAVQEEFITGVWGIINGNMGIRYGINRGHFLYEALDSNLFCCADSSVVYFDTARSLGIKTLGISVVTERNPHMVIGTADFYVETTRGQYRSIDKIRDGYRAITGVSQEPGEFESLGHHHRLSGHLKERDVDGIIEYLRKAVDSNPLDSFRYTWMGFIYLVHKQDFDKAVWFLDKAVKLTPENYITYNYLGEAYCGKGDYGEAVKNFKKAFDLNRSFTEAGIRLGSMYYKQKNYKSAIEAFTQVIDGRNLMQAINDFAQSHENARESEPYLLRGLCNLRTGDYGKAASDFGTGRLVGFREVADFLFRDKNGSRPL